jgi:hypothetical protein
MKLLFALFALVVMGCGSNAVQIHTAAIQTTALAHAGVFASVDAARDVALDAVEAEHPTQGPERNAALDAEAGRWRPAGAALDSIRTALLLWLDAVEAASEDDDLWDDVLPLVARLAQLWGDVVRLAGTLGLELPSLPPVVAALAGGT